MRLAHFPGEIVSIGIVSGRRIRIGRNRKRERLKMRRRVLGPSRNMGERGKEGDKRYSRLGQLVHHD
jgi:hypothetical protein